MRPDLGRIEKWILRNAFDVEEKPYLPKVGCFPLSQNVFHSVLYGFVLLHARLTKSILLFSIYCIGRRNSSVMALDTVG